MSEFGPQIAATVVETCRKNAGEIGEALSRALDRPIAATIGDTAAWDSKLASGPGLVVVLEIGTSAAIMVAPAGTGLLPAWYAEPDATGKSKLATLAQELGMLLLPDAFMPGESSTLAVDDLAAAIERGGVSAEAGCIPISLLADEKPHQVHLLWPATAPKRIHPPDPAPSSSPAAVAPTLPPERIVPEERRPQRPADEDPFDTLPPYSRSLLHIRVPVMVTLAAKKQPVSKIVELVPGSILQFNKSCDELLDLEVSGLPVAKGECVKVGDKFGLRVSSLVLPAERFKPVQ